MTLIALFASLGLACLALCLILSMRIPDSAIDPEVGAYRMQGRSVSHKMTVEAAIRYWFIKKLVGDTGVILNVRIRPSDDGVSHIDGFMEGLLTDGTTFDIPLSLTPTRSK